MRRSVINDYDKFIDSDKFINDVLVARIREGDGLTDTELANALRRYKDPLLDYAAGRLDSTIKRKRQPKKDYSSARTKEDYFLWQKVRRCQSAYKRLCKMRGIKPSYAREVACEHVAKRTSIPKDTVDKRTRSREVAPNVFYFSGIYVIDSGRSTKP
jgi:hypothetical protein